MIPEDAERFVRVWHKNTALLQRAREVSRQERKRLARLYARMPILRPEEWEEPHGC